MPRRVQDIIPNNHRSVRDIPIERTPSIMAPIQPNKKRSGRPVPLQRITDDADETSPSDNPRVSTPFIPPRRPRRSGTKKWLFLLMGIVVVVAIAAYLASVHFSYATFTIAPKSIPFSVNSTYIAQGSTGAGALVYELAVVKEEASATVAAVDGPKQSIAAQGKITVYNVYSTQSQRLIAGTRFADSSGRVYRLTSSIVVPGYTSSGSVVTPGTITTTVAADQPGQSYNISKADQISDFKIVAYKGTPRYETMYGRLATEISGGFVGTKKTVNPDALASTTTALQAKVIAAALAQLKETVPEGYILYPTAYVPVFASPLVGGDDPRTATVTVRGTVYGILFKHADLVERVAGEQAVAAFDDFSYETPGLESLDFDIANAKDFSPEKKNTLIIKLKGDAAIRGLVPVEELKAKMAGLSLIETSDVLREFKPVIEIEKSSGSVTPPWSRVPADTDRITVEVLTE